MPLNSCNGKLTATSRGFCPSCGAKRMVEHAALLVDEILPEAPYRQWVLSVPFQLRFLFASKPEVMSKALGIVYRTIATHLVLAAGHTHDTAHTGAITFIQRFGSALNLNVHFHMLFLDGVYVGNKANKLTFKQVNAPTNDQLQTGLQAAVSTQTHERKKLDRISRYIARPAIPEPRLSLTKSGNVRYELKTPYRDGTTHVIFDPLDLDVQGCTNVAGAWMRRSDHGQTGSFSAKAQNQSHALPRGIRTQQRAAGGNHAQPTRQGRQERRRHCHYSRITRR